MSEKQEKLPDPDDVLRRMLNTPPKPRKSKNKANPDLCKSKKDKDNKENRNK